ncbi:NUDIX hydrolase, partial [Pseudomonas neuropathica]
PQNEIAACKWLAPQKLGDLKASSATKTIVQSYANESEDVAGSRSHVTV